MKLEVVPTDSPQNTVSVAPIRVSSQDENGSRIEERFGVSRALILNSVDFTEIYL